MWKPERLVTASIQLLRWADSEDDPKLIERVIKIQDHLLALEWPGIEDALNKAERELNGREIGSHLHVLFYKLRLK